MLSLSSRRAWIEIRACCDNRLMDCKSRSPRGERGLKLFLKGERLMRTSGGRSPRGERGLKFCYRSAVQDKLGRSPRGERGLKSWHQAVLSCSINGRSPRGERGLKCLMTFSTPIAVLSLSSRRAWIEIKKLIDNATRINGALLAESVD